MHDVTDIERQSDLTRKQVYDRLKVLEPIIHDHVTTGRHRRKLLSEQGFSIFNRLLSLEREGLTWDDAVQRIKNELPSQNDSEQTPSGQDSESSVNGHNRDPIVAVLEARIADKDREIEWLRRRVEQLEERNSELQQLALPNPDRRPWLARLLGVGGAMGASDR